MQPPPYVKQLWLSFALCMCHKCVLHIYTLYECVHVVNSPFLVRPNYYAVGGVIASATHWGKKCDVHNARF